MRIARPADAGAIAGIYAPIVRETAASFEEEPPDAAEIARRLRRIGGQLPWLVAHEAAEQDAVTGAGGGSGATEQDVLGYALATPYRSRAAYRWSVEVTVYVDESARGRGVARSLYRRLHDLLREQGYRLTYAVITLPNPASVGLHEALQYERIGICPRAGYKLGTWHDVLWMRRELGPIVGSPAEPVPLGMLDQATVDAVLV